MNLDPRLLRLAWKEKGLLLLTIACGLAGGGLILFQARQLSRILNAVFLGGQTLPQVWPLLLSLLPLLLLRPGFSWLGEWSGSRLAILVKDNIRSALIRKLVELGPAYTAGEETGELAASAVQGIDQLDAYFAQYLPQVALAALLPMIMLAVVFPLDSLTGWVLLLTAPLLPFFMALIGKNSEKLTGKQFTALRRMSALFLDLLQGLTTLKLLGQHQRTGQVAEVSERYRVVTLSVLRVTFLSALALELIATISTAVVAVEIGLRLLYGRLVFEQAFFVLVLAPEFYFPLRQLGLRFHAAMSGIAAAQRIQAVLDEPLLEPVVSSSHSVYSITLAAPLNLRFEQVSFRYLGREQDAIDEVSFSLRSGEMLALVGDSGAGKSTIARLVLGFQHPTYGRITVNGQDLAALPLEAWRSQLAWVPQRPHLFSGSLADNLRLAKPDATPGEMRAALEQAELRNWLDQQPAGLETHIGEQGGGLSGGQAQRVALARAFLRDAPLLVLDEPTAHLDPLQEQALEAATRRLCAGRAVLVIAHRLPTVARADRVLVLQAGRVVESGSPGELARLNGPFSRLTQVYRGAD